MKNTTKQNLKNTCPFRDKGMLITKGKDWKCCWPSAQSPARWHLAVDL